MLIKLNHTSTKPEAPRRHSLNAADSLDQIDTSSSGAMLHSMLTARMERTGETPLEMFANAEGRVAELLTIQPNTGYELPFLLAEDIAAVELDAARFTKTYVDAFRLLHHARLRSSLR